MSTKIVCFDRYAVGRGTKQLLILDSGSGPDSGSDKAELQGVSLQAGLTLLMAPNGFGKSTLLQTMAGVLPALSGALKFGVEQRQLNVERDLFYVSEYLSFPRYLKASEWVDVFASRDPEFWHPDWLRMESLMSRYLGELSQGERRKVTWLAAHASGRPLLLMDEPLDGLDFYALEGARKFLRLWEEEGRAVLMIAHQVSEVIEEARQIWAIRDGSIIELKATAESRQNPAELRRRLGELYPWKLEGAI